MSNKYHTDNPQLRVNQTAPRPAVSPGGIPTPMFESADDPPYNADIGPGGPDMNRAVGAPYVRVHMKSKMSPFQGGGGVLSPQQASPAPGGAGSPLTATQPLGTQVDERPPGLARQGLL
ncbi:MAG: hypothetical protein ACRD5H_01510 [Nitrososphaerales archaeon]